MSEFAENPPVYNYVVSVGNREYIITILKDGMSQWDDLSLGNLGERIADEKVGSVAEVQISKEIYALALAMAEKEKADETRKGQLQPPAGEVAQDIEKMDRMFVEFFWCRVNPTLALPLDGPTRARS